MTTLNRWYNAGMKRYLLPAFGLVLIIGYLNFVFMNTNDINQKTRENNAYLRTVACILSVPLVERTDQYISNCYEQAETENKLHVDRFGNK